MSEVRRTVWLDIERAIADATGKPFKVRNATAVSGGCINEAFCLEGERQSYLVKLNSADRLAMFEAEAAGLAAIRASSSVRAPRELACGTSGHQSWLAMEFIRLGEPGRNSAALLGEQLAAMHNSNAGRFGWERDNTIGATPQANPWNSDWVEFFKQHRLGFQLRLAAGNGAPAPLLEGGKHLLARLPEFFTTYRPAPSLLHGDLWGGNWGTDERGNPVLFDPATYFGDREADLAMTELFGGFDHSFYAAYNAAWPLDGGYQVRKRLYNLYHLLNHFNLFGGSYARQAQRSVEYLLAQL